MEAQGAEVRRIVEGLVVAPNSGKRDRVSVRPSSHDDTDVVEIRSRRTA